LKIKTELINKKELKLKELEKQRLQEEKENNKENLVSLFTDLLE
jgi:hypothetical protein